MPSTQHIYSTFMNSTGQCLIFGHELPEKFDTMSLNTDLPSLFETSNMSSGLQNGAMLISTSLLQINCRRHMYSKKKWTNVAIVT